MNRYHQPERAPCLDTVGVDHPAIDIFRLSLHLCRPRRKWEFRQLQRFGKGQLLLGLAEARAVLALIIDRTAQVAVQRQPPGLQLFLQHHRPHKTLDQFKDRGQVIGNQNLCFQRELRLEGAAGTCSGQSIPENLQFHATRSFPVRLAHFMPCNETVCAKNLPDSTQPSGRFLLQVLFGALFDAEQPAQQPPEKFRTFYHNHLHGCTPPFTGFAPV